MHFIKILLTMLLALLSTPIWAESFGGNQKIANQEIKAMASIQDAQGKTQKDFDMTFLEKLEAYYVDRVKIKIKENLAYKGYPNDSVELTSESVYIVTGGLKLAVVRMKSNDIANQVFITGIIGNELKRVVCARGSKETIPITYGVCADKIKEVFGIKIGA